MNYSKFEFLKKCEIILFENLKLIFEDFVSEVESKLIIRSDKLSWIETNFTNFENNKAVQVIVSEGINADNEQSYSIRFNILKLNFNKERISSFSINDYCTEKNISIQFNWFFVGRVDFIYELSNFMASALLVLKSEEMQKILFTDYWIDIKPDFSPYR
jgi:hypothetical protein